MATYVIGDVHGCYRPLLELLDLIGYDPAADFLWFIGDLVNRGPESLNVLRFVQKLGNRANSLLGNHDLHLLAIAHGVRDHKGKDTILQVLESNECDQHMEWLRKRPLLHHDEERDFTIVHAGLPPQWDLDVAKSCAAEVETAIRGEQFVPFLRDIYAHQTGRPQRWSEDLTGFARLRFIANCLTLMRYCDPTGLVDLRFKGPPGSQAPPFVPWYAVDGRKNAGLRIIFGHWSTLGERSQSGVHSIDTGCLWGGWLTALRIEDDAFVPFRVACRQYRKPG